MDQFFRGFIKNFFLVISYCAFSYGSFYSQTLSINEFSNGPSGTKEYIEFIEAGGYEDFNLWHAEGWDYINTNNINSPLYWHFTKGEWHFYNFNGLEPVTLNEPVMHINYYEAFAYAQWQKMRLPTEFARNKTKQHWFYCVCHPDRPQ